MPYWRLYHHAVWATKNRTPLIQETMTDPITRAIEQTARDTGVTVFAVGIMPDHVHVLAQIPPTLEVSTVIGRWKGASSHSANEFRPEALPKLIWQEGYGVISVSHHGFEQTKDNVLRQRERHASRDLHRVLERLTDAAE